MVLVLILNKRVVLGSAVLDLSNTALMWIWLQLCVSVLLLPPKKNRRGPETGNENENMERLLYLGEDEKTGTNVFRKK